MDSKTDAQYSALATIRRRIEPVFMAIPSLLSVEYVFDGVHATGLSSGFIYLHFTTEQWFPRPVCWLLNNFLGATTGHLVVTDDLSEPDHVYHSDAKVFESCLPLNRRQIPWITAPLIETFVPYMENYPYYFLFPASKSCAFPTKSGMGNKAAYVTEGSIIVRGVGRLTQPILQSLPWDEYERRR